MLNIFKRSRPKVNWWSTVEGLEKVCPILPAKDAPLPKWWSGAPSFVNHDLEDKGTIKNCPAIPDFMSLGYVVPLWCDTHFLFSEDGEYTVTTSDERFSFTCHSDEQFLDHLPQGIRKGIHIVMKANCPWRVRTSDGYAMLQLPLFYHYDHPFEVMPGVIWTDIHHEINQQMAFKSSGSFTLKRGMPLAAYVPYRREGFETIIEGPNKTNMGWAVESSTHLWTKFRAGYRIHQSEVKKKCPFHK
jgi:hypothetical protein